MASKQPNPILPLHTRFGPYHLEKLIAVGGMAEIYLARAKGLAGFEKQLALKVILADFASDERFSQMLVQEAKLAVELNHANIVKTFDLGKIDNVYFITMEYIDGADYFRVLKELSDHDENIPVEAALYVAREAASGLDYAHTRCDDRGEPLGLIHRDISPQNILLSRHGEVKVADFGVAKVANVSSQTRAGVIKGKLVYMSPEQSWGGQIDQRSDIFSAGIVLYEALTGGSLYVEQNPVKLLEQVRDAEIAPPSALRPDLGTRLDELVMRALARDPADRYQTARELEHAIGAFLRDYAPDYSARDLAELVCSIADNAPRPKSKRDRAPNAGADLEPMERKDFAIAQHSIVYASQPRVAEGSSLSPAALEELALQDGPLSAKIILEREDGSKTYEVKERFTIGRGGELRLTDGRVSRRHARIVKRNREYLIEDLSSSNGTFVNRERISEPYSLASGDVIHIGPYQLRFMLEREGDTTRQARGQEVVSEPRAARRATSVAPHVEQPVPAPAKHAAVAEPPPKAPAPPAPAARESGAAYVTLQIGDELLRVPLADHLPLGHSLEVGGQRIDAAGGAIVRRGDGYWVEPATGRVSVLINGRNLAEPEQLTPGDELQVGPLSLKFHSS